MRVLVTGAAGFIGSSLAERLVARGDEVVGVDNFDPFYPRAVKERNLAALRQQRGFAFHELDLADPAAPLAALLTADTAVVHLAAKAGVRPSLRDPAGYLRANLTATQALVDAMRAAGATRLAFGSSSSVYGDDTPAPFREDYAAIHPISPMPPPSGPGSWCSRRWLPTGGSGSRRSGSSRSTGRGSGPTSRSTASPAGSPRASRSPCSAPVPRGGTTPILRTS
ncbi:MAG: NAD-dependent epimerase/dehydratase family protein [Gemmatimonadetes bacterium]|nr:NAD-dependent epimerase/dehydratase family protein [Gemmatimonadota bacterium]